MSCTRAATSCPATASSGTSRPCAPATADRWSPTGPSWRPRRSWAGWSSSRPATWPRPCASPRCTRRRTWARSSAGPSRCGPSRTPATSRPAGAGSQPLLELLGPEVVLLVVVRVGPGRVEQAEAAGLLGLVLDEGVAGRAGEEAVLQYLRDAVLHEQVAGGVEGHGDARLDLDAVAAHVLDLVLPEHIVVALDVERVVDDAVEDVLLDVAVRALDHEALVLRVLDLVARGDVAVAAEGDGG